MYSEKKRENKERKKEGGFKIWKTQWRKCLITADWHYACLERDLWDPNSVWGPILLSWLLCQNYAHNWVSTNNIGRLGIAFEAFLHIPENIV